MGTDAQLSQAEFYATPRGGVARQLLAERLLALWPDLNGQLLLGLGHTNPYLALWRGTAAACLSVSLAPGAAARWPEDGANLACAAEESALPFPGQSADRILLVHGLENAENARRMLREIWRVLADDGRLIVVAPNRVGWWAHVESTPFGQGQPYSPGQIGRLLAAGMFRVERRDYALYVPPLSNPLVLRTARLWERAGRNLAPQFAGLTITEAVKDVYAAVPLATVPVRRRLVLSEPA